MRRVLVLEGRRGRADAALRLQDWEVVRASSPRAVESILAQAPIRVGLIAVDPGDPPLWIEAVLASFRATRWIALVEREALQSEHVRRLIARRCHDFHTRPVHWDQLQWTLGHAHGIGDLDGSLTAQSDPDSLPDLFGVSPAMARLRRMAERFAATDAPVMITGESGAGKELVARYIHIHSSRREHPFVVINCAAIPAELMQSELFGYERGAFTGANERKIGRIEQAIRGTVFFDEVAELPLLQQSTLLRFLEEGAIVRVGGHRPIKTDVRIVAATNRDLERGLMEGWFRRDLYHRLHVLHLRVPSLRERREDIVALATRFVDDCNRETGVAKHLSPRALDRLVAHDWPGNVRELRNCLRRAVLLAEHTVLQPQDLGLDAGESTGLPGAVSLEEARGRAERLAVQAALMQCNGNLSLAARALGVSRMTLYRLLRRFESKDND